MSSTPEKAKVVVVGGGMSGLWAAYLLRDLKPIVLEQADRFGGNSRGESWDGVDYSIGAAYFSAPDPESRLKVLYDELDLPKLCRVRHGEDPVEWRTELRHGFWQEHEPFARYMRSLGTTEPFPEVPALSVEQRKLVDSLDRHSLLSWLDEKAGPLPESLRSAIEYYCWSSLNAPAAEVSAATGLNFLASESAATWVAPGGNAAVAERILERLLGVVPRDHLRPEALVTRVEVKRKGARVVYEDGEGKVNAIEADAVVMACPKFVVGKILEGIEPARLAAIRRLKYRGYLVANLCLEKAAPAEFFDLLLLGDGKLAEASRATDVVYGNFAAEPEGKGTVLTLYRPVPMDGARAKLLAEDGYEGVRKEFESQIESGLMKLPPFREAVTKDLRIARWGHAIPVSEKGIFAGKLVDAVRKPFRGRVFFVEQDNWMTPAMETGAIEAIAWEPAIRAAVRGGQVT